MSGTLDSLKALAISAGILISLPHAWPPKRDGQFRGICKGKYPQGRRSQSNGGSCSKDAVSIPLATSGRIPMRT